VGPFVFTFSQAWHPVKHRDLVYTTANIMVTVVSLVTVVGHIPSVWSTGHAITSAGVYQTTARCMVIPLCESLLLRPSRTTMSVTCTVHAALFATTGYFANAFDTLELAMMVWRRFC